MEPVIYVIQAFSRGDNGSLVWDAPAWSRDRAFAVSLTQALSRSKAGVMTIGASLSASGEIAAEGEIVASHGCVPTGLFLADALNETSEALHEPHLRSA